MHTDALSHEPALHFEPRLELSTSDLPPPSIIPLLLGAIPLILRLPSNQTPESRRTPIMDEIAPEYDVVVLGTGT